MSAPPAGENGIPAIAIDVVSDVVCPWCYIGKRRLAAALALRPQVTAVLHWRPFQLDATIPAAGMPRRDYLRRKFGSDQAIAAIYARVAEAGRAEGIDFRFDLIERSPNTLDAHRLIRWAGAAAAQDRVVERLFDLYFRQGRDIGDRAVLSEAAAAAGLDGDEIRQRLAGEDDKAAVEEEVADAARLGIAGVPCFILDGRVGVSGAQRPQVLAAAIDQVLAKRG